VAVAAIGFRSDRRHAFAALRRLAPLYIFGILFFWRFKQELPLLFFAVYALILAFRYPRVAGDLREQYAKTRGLPARALTVDEVPHRDERRAI
jgi:hypothetical protein